MNLSELRKSIHVSRAIPPPDWDALWDEVDERDFVRAAEKAVEDRNKSLSRVPGEDDEEFVESDDDQDWPTALSLLETAMSLMVIAQKFLDARNFVLPADSDHAFTTTILDIKQFLSSYEESKTTVMGPVQRVLDKPTHVSYNCAHQKCSKCDVIRCDCECHNDEIKESEI